MIRTSPGRMMCVLLSLSIFLSGCSLLPPVRPGVSIDLTTITTPSQTSGSDPSPTGSPGTDDPTSPVTEPVTSPATCQIMNIEYERVISAQCAAIAAGKADPDSVILTPEQIAAENARMLAASESLTDLRTLPQTLGADRVLSLIQAIRVPGYGYYNEARTQIDPGYLQTLLDSRALDGIPETVNVRRAVCVDRTSIRSLPTPDRLYSSATDPCDRLQLSELICGAPVLVLHESPDAGWFFVLSEWYTGWCAAQSLAFCSDGDWERFRAAGDVTDDRFTVTAHKVVWNGIQLDMGCSFPCAGTDDGAEVISLPGRNPDGELAVTDLQIPENCTFGVRGVLPFTWRNLVEQAFLFEGMPYGWGGLEGNTDCSGFAASVFRSFGFRFPRDTTDQNPVVGNRTDLSAMTAQQKANALDLNAYPALIYLKGHVMIFLQKQEGGWLFIHAPRTGQTVSTTLRTDLSDLLSLNAFGPAETN